MSSLFGGNANTNTNQSGGGGGGGLFGSTTNQSSGGGGLFGSASNTTTQQSNTGGGGGLFGNNNNQASNTSGSGGGLFGSSTTANQQSNTGGGLFGAKPSTGTGGGLFGAASNTNTAPSTGGGLFGGTSNTNQTSNTGGGLFGGNQNTSNTSTNTSSLFGGANQNTANNAGSTSLFGKPATGGTSLFGGSTAQPQQQNQTSSLFGGAGQNQQQQQQAPASNASVFNPQTVSVGNLGHTMTHNQLQRLQFAGASTVPNEKRISQQIQTITKKWSPDMREDESSQTNPRKSTILQTYLYNAVPKEYAPFFYPDFARGEDEKSWEEALSQKPELPKVDGQEVTGLAYVPILVVGFKALGERVETQAKIVQEMRSRLHEMNNSLSAVMDAHQQRITVRIAAAKRQHQVLSQRCLKLAVKVQVLRNRGYALDAQEENLRKTLLSLERQVTDPGLIGREDEIWARMLALRERARWLEEEGKRVSAQVEQNQQANGAASSGISEDILAKTRKILKDYDGQLQHLNKELEDVKREYAEWEQTRNRR